MNIIITLLVILGGILGCGFVVLIDQTFTWRNQGKVNLVKKSEKIQYVLGFFAVLFIFLAVLLSNI